VENLDTACLSLTTEFQTWGSRVVNGAYFTNGVLRKAGLPTAALDGAPKIGLAAMWAASLALKRMGVVKDRISTLERAFDLDEALPAR
jgi:hypothetical protein